MMQSAVVGLIWECWRLSRRWYLWVLPVAIAIHLYNMEQAPAYMERMQRFSPSPTDITTLYHFFATRAFMMNLIFATITTLLATSLGNKSGFPLSFEFRLPIKTPLLVLVPTLFLAGLCASLYIVPALLGRFLYGIPFPLLSVAMLLCTMVIVLLACGWATTSTASRMIAMIAALTGGLKLYRWVAPLNLPGNTRAGRDPFTSDVFALTPLEYAVLVALCVGLFGLVLYCIRQQRCGETLLSGLAALRASRQAGSEGTEATRSASSGTFLDRITDLFLLPCPVRIPWHAELWLELKRHALPILLFSFVLALFIPVLLTFSNANGDSLGNLDYIFPLGVLTTGIGLAIFNRRWSTGGYMSAFEGTRGMGTVKLALIQVLALGASCLCGILLVCVSLYLTWPLVDEPGSLGKQLRDLPDVLADRSVLLLLNELVAVLGLYLSIFALFTCVHVCSVIWGRFFPVGMAVLALYGIGFTFGVNRGTADLDDIKQHMWAFAGAVLLLTLLSLGKALHRKLFSLRSGLSTLVGWGIFVACGIYSLSGRGIVLPDQAPELQAFNAALLLLPLTLFILLIWAYDRLRHR